MALNIGSIAPDFNLPSTSGESLNYHQDVKGPSILYFYPKDFTPGCTAEACEFRDDYEFFDEMGVPIYGISKDSVKSHLKFIEQYKLPFQLLSDQSGKVTKEYKAMFPFINMPRRITYLVDSDKRIIEVFENLLQAKDHIKKMKLALGKIPVK